MGIAVLSVLALSSSAFASNDAAMNVNITGASSTVGAGSTGLCDWTVTSDVTVVNRTSDVLDVKAVDPYVSWTGPGGTSGVVNPATTTYAAGLEAGDTIPPSSQGSYVTYSGYQVTFAIPCSATEGDLAVELTTQYGAGSGDAPFLSGGTPLPVGAVGGAVLAFGLGGVFFLAQRRKRHVTDVVASSPHQAAISS
jgi:hypothetical protein